jgi:hypothetical protein
VSLTTLDNKAIVALYNDADFQQVQEMGRAYWAYHDRQMDLPYANTDSEGFS